MFTQQTHHVVRRNHLVSAALINCPRVHPRQTQTLRHAPSSPPTARRPRLPPSHGRDHGLQLLLTNSCRVCLSPAACVPAPRAASALRALRRYTLLRLRPRRRDNARTAGATGYSACRLIRTLASSPLSVGPAALWLSSPLLCWPALTALARRPAPQILSVSPGHHSSAALAPHHVCVLSSSALYINRLSLLSPSRRFLLSAALLLVCHGS
jgi:hypothetical protein